MPHTHRNRVTTDHNASRRVGERAYTNTRITSRYPLDHHYRLRSAADFYEQRLQDDTWKHRLRMTIYNGKSLFELIGFEKRTRFMGFSFAKETLEVGLKNAAELVKYVFMYAAVKHAVNGVFWRIYLDDPVRGPILCAYLRGISAKMRNPLFGRAIRNMANCIRLMRCHITELVNEVDDGLHPALMKRVGQSDVYEVHTTKIMHVLLSTFVDFLPLIYDVVYNGPAEFKELDEIKAFFP